MTINVLYYSNETKDAYGDEEEYVGQDTVKSGIHTVQFATQEKVEEFLSDLSVSAGESEGHEHYKILAIYDAETGWYDQRYTK